MRSIFHLLRAALLSLGVAICQASPQQTPATTPSQSTKVAEGSYGPYDSWTLWRTADGYRAEIEMKWAGIAKEARQTETMTLSRDFHMKSVRYESKNWSAMPDGALECAVKEYSLDCATTFRNAEGRGSIPVAGAYAAQFGVEIALLDVPWFYTSLVAHAGPNPRRPTQVKVPWLALDGQTKEDLVTANVHSGEVGFLAREVIQVLGKPVNSFKYKVSARHLDATIWIAESGLLLALDWGGLRLDLTRFRQYEDFVPELKGAAEFAEEKKPERTKVAEGSFYYTSEAAGQKIGSRSDEWTLFRTAGGFALETTVHVPARMGSGRIAEFIQFTPAFQMTSFRQNSSAWEPNRDEYYSCDLDRTHEKSYVVCHNTFKGQEGTRTIPIGPPYVFEATEKEPLLDWPFAYASLVSAATREPQKVTELSVVYVTIADEPTGSPTGTSVEGIVEIQYLGREQISILRRPITAHKFAVADEMFVWVAENGMPLMLEHRKHPRHWELDRYKQYEPLIPELKETMSNKSAQ